MNGDQSAYSNGDVDDGDEDEKRHNEESDNNIPIMNPAKDNDREASHRFLIYYQGMPL